jgi:hypothetical protein
VRRKQESGKHNSRKEGEAEGMVRRKEEEINCKFRRVRELTEEKVRE